ncbi:unnamed protein product [Calypogeia fissa]
MAMKSKVQLQSSDDVTFGFNSQFLQGSQLLIDAMKDTEECPVFLSTIPSKILTKLIKYSTYHAQATQSNNGSPAITEDEIKQWDAAFVEVDHRTLAGLITAAKHLHMKPLSDLLWERAAGLIRSSKSDELRRAFGIYNV